MLRDGERAHRGVKADPCAIPSEQAQAHEDAPAEVESHRADIIDRAREEDQRPRLQCFAPRWRCLSDAPGPAVLLRNRPASAKRALSSVRGGMSSAFTGRR